jgi:pimeloyl-ACP methyl ester carboxylesterase
VHELELSSGPIRYRDTGQGPPILFVHGVFVNGTLWRKVATPLSANFRCITPDWPLGAHTIPMADDADLAPRAVARLIGEFLDALDLRDVTLVANDTGGALAQLLLAEGCDRIGRLVLTPCDSFENFLPRSIRALQYLARVPGSLTVLLQPLRLPRPRGLAFHWLAKQPLPDDITKAWLQPLLAQRAIRRDLAKFLRAIDYRETVAAAEHLRAFQQPVLLLWPRDAPYFPFTHAQQWSEIFPNAQLIEVADSYTFVSEDQPKRVARAIAQFVNDSDLIRSPPTTANDVC